MTTEGKKLHKERRSENRKEGEQGKGKMGKDGSKAQRKRKNSKM